MNYYPVQFNDSPIQCFWLWCFS